jgi:hypothetical protein
VSNGAVVGNSLKSSNARILHTKGKESGKYPLTTTAEIVNLLKCGRAVVNFLSDSFIKDLGVGGAALTFEKLGVKPGTQWVLGPKPLRMDNGTNKLEPGSVSFFEFTPIEHLKTGYADATAG